MLAHATVCSNGSSNLHPTELTTLLVFFLFSERLHSCHVFQTVRRVAIPTYLVHTFHAAFLREWLARHRATAVFLCPCKHFQQGIAGTCASVLNKRIMVSRLIIQFYRQQGSAGPIYVRTANLFFCTADDVSEGVM